jgi:hypothetical protein
MSRSRLSTSPHLSPHPFLIFPKTNIPPPPSLSFPASSPNAAFHFAIGDLVKWSGIKRCGAAMHMGYFAANNLAQQMQVAMGTTKEPEMKELAEIPAMIGLAVGKKAVAYWPEAGVTSGEDVNKAFFGDDLGFTSESFFF